MIVIGLLMSGILKGQELVESARVTATTSQIKQLNAAILTFRDKYGVLPGDITNPGARLPTCAQFAGPVGCNVGGNDDGVLSAAEAPYVPTHLAAADLLSGYGASGTTGIPFPGGGAPAILESRMTRGAGLYIHSQPGGAAVAACSVIGPADLRAGIYVNLQVPGACTNSGPLLPNEARRIDSKLDDGIPGSGSVRAEGDNAGVAATCGSATQYLETTVVYVCGLKIRLQAH
jgi:hypothetical protein